MTPDDLRARLLACLGGPWPDSPPLEAEVLASERKEGYRVDFVAYSSPSGLGDGVVDRIPACLLVPDGVDGENPAPAVAVWHQHKGEWDLGKSEPAGLAGDPAQHVGPDLAREGYVVLCPDALCFEERRDATGRLGGGDFERFEFLRYLVDGKCLAWRNILDMRRAVDFLVSLPGVRAGRIGCFGHSMGATHTWLVGPFEPRLAALAGSCCLPTYDAIHRHGLLHCFPNFVPGWRLHGDTPEIAALVAPRALHLCLGEEDEGSPIEEARAGLSRIAAAYAEAGVPEAFVAHVEPGVGHALAPAMWEGAKAFLRARLRADEPSSDEPRPQGAQAGYSHGAR